MSGLKYWKRINKMLRKAQKKGDWDVYNMMYNEWQRALWEI